MFPRSGVWPPPALWVVAAGAVIGEGKGDVVVFGGGVWARAHLRSVSKGLPWLFHLERGVNAPV